MSVLEQILRDIRNCETDMEEAGVSWLCPAWVEAIIKKHLSAEDTNVPTNDGWIPVEKGLPECEQEVFILTERGTKTTALYEDGRVPESKSKWNWTDIQGEWDDEEDCMIIPEGWWEYRHFNPDDVYNCPVDEKVIAWRPLPEPYKPEKLV